MDAHVEFQCHLNFGGRGAVGVFDNHNDDGGRLPGSPKEKRETLARGARLGKKC